MIYTFSFPVTFDL